MSQQRGTWGTVKQARLIPPRPARQVVRVIVNGPSMTRSVSDTTPPTQPKSAHSADSEHKAAKHLWAVGTSRSACSGAADRKI